MKYANFNLGQIEAVFNKLGGEDGVRRFLRGEITVSESARSWREADGVIYFSVTSDGTTGEDWVIRLESKGFRVTSDAKQVLRSPDFKPTSAVTTKVAVLKGVLFADSDWTTKEICDEAGKRKLSKPNAELACLIREKFTGNEIEAMGLRDIVAMHEPINGFNGYPSLLGVCCYDLGRWINVCNGRPDIRWAPGFGFAFAESQVSES